MLQLTVKRPGSLLSVYLKANITEETYLQIAKLLTEPDQYQVTKRPPMGFRPPLTWEPSHPNIIKEG